LATPQKPYGATWADFAIALVDFAREEPWTFGVFLVIVIVALWFLFPRATVALGRKYQADILRELNRLSSKDDADA
jgi:hypothetical protein